MEFNEKYNFIASGNKYVLLVNPCTVFDAKLEKVG